MFGVGLHFSLNDLLSVRTIALPGAIVQIAVATCMGLGLALFMGWTVGAGLVFGLALSVASTVVLLRAIQERHLMETERGRIAVGWLIVEDLTMVLALVLLPALANMFGGTGGALTSDPLAARLGLGLAGVLLLTFAKVAVFVGFMLIVGRRLIPWVLHYIAHTGSRELFRLCVLAIALCVAFGAAKLFGVSLALGAFFAGMILSESPLSQRAAQEVVAVAGRLRRLVLCVCRNALRSGKRFARAMAFSRNSAHHYRWQVGSRVRYCARISAPAHHSSPDIGKPCPDR